MNFGDGCSAAGLPIAEAAAAIEVGLITISIGLPCGSSMVVRLCRYVPLLAGHMPVTAAMLSEAAIKRDLNLREEDNDQAFEMQRS
jgi:hypothetical protein